MIFDMFIRVASRIGGRRNDPPDYDELEEYMPTDEEMRAERRLRVATQEKRERAIRKGLETDAWIITDQRYVPEGEYRTYFIPRRDASMYRYERETLMQTGTITTR